MKYYILLILMAGSSMAFAQQDQTDINNQVWKPFTKAIMAQDASLFMAVHSADVVRVEIDAKEIQNFTDYKAALEKGWPGWKESMAKNGSKYTFELRFIERISNSRLAYETGYFKNESTNAKGEIKKYFGKFHVTLRKENGIWKILVDSDSNDGGAITEEMFLKAKPLE
jgi:ketosteroid isomerase-like protein